MTTTELALTSTIALTKELTYREWRGDQAVAEAVRAELHRRGYYF